jgi:hypothetical protein
VQILPVIGGIVEGFPVHRETKSREDGSFAFEPVVAGVEYQLLVEEGDGRMWALLTTFTAEPGADVDVGLVMPQEQ